MCQRPSGFINKNSNFKLQTISKKGMLYVECYIAAIIRTVISLKNSYHAVWVRSLPQDLKGTGNNPVNNRLFHLKLIMCFFSLLIKWFYV